MITLASLFGSLNILHAYNLYKYRLCLSCKSNAINHVCHVVKLASLTMRSPTYCNIENWKLTHCRTTYGEQMLLTVLPNLLIYLNTQNVQFLTSIRKQIRSFCKTVMPWLWPIKVLLNVLVCLYRLRVCLFEISLVTIYYQCWIMFSMSPNKCIFVAIIFFFFFIIQLLELNLRLATMSYFELLARFISFCVSTNMLFVYFAFFAATAADR